jgi:hypothetical protein
MQLQLQQMEFSTAKTNQSLMTSPQLGWFIGFTSQKLVKSLSSLISLIFRLIDAIFSTGLISESAVQKKTTKLLNVPQPFFFC